MGGGHEIDIFCTLGDEVFEEGPKLHRIHGLSHRTAADGGILAVFTPQCAAAEKHCTAAAAASQGRFFPFVEHGFRHQCGAGAAAEAHLSGASVRAALPGTELAVCIIHRNTSFAY